MLIIFMYYTIICSRNLHTPRYFILFNNSRLTCTLVFGILYFMVARNQLYGNTYTIG